MNLDAAELDAAAAAADGELGPPPVDGSFVLLPRPPGNREAIGFIIESARELLTVALGVESLRVTLASDRAQACAEVLAPVADKYGIDLHASFGAYAVELAAITVAGPLLWTAWRELNAELELRNARRAAKPEPAINPVPPGDPAAGPGLDL